MSVHPFDFVPQKPVACQRMMDKLRYFVSCCHGVQLCVVALVVVLDILSTVAHRLTNQNVTNT